MSPYIHEAVPHRRKRVRFSPNSSSEPSVSDLASTTAASSTTNASEYDSDGESSEPSESSEDPSSEDSSSEDEADDDDDEGEDTEMEDQASPDGVVNLRANRGKKPVMKLREDEDLGPDIRGFLKDFLPKLKEANEELERQREAGTLKSLDAGGEEDGEPYIEMVSCAGSGCWACANEGAGSWARCLGGEGPG
jgi:hypothetical protein